MFYKGSTMADIARSFIDSAGAERSVQVVIGSVEKRNPFVRNVKGNSLKDKILSNLADDNVLTQKGLIEMFCATVGASTVLMPFGGKTQRTETQVSAQKLPV
jgi:phosphoribosylformylglycinamidine synthase